MSEPILETARLSKSYGDVVAVDKLDLSIKRGEVLGLLGINGAGKTTFMQMLLGLIKPTSGTIHIFGQPFEKSRIAILGRMNFSSTYANLPNNLTVWQNLLVFSKIYGLHRPQAKIEELLQLFEIVALKDRVAGHLSSGESTRLNLCKALLNDPELLLLDEPTASLDPEIADKVRRIIVRIQREKDITMLYTSHNMRDIESICQRIVFIHQGRKLAEGTPEAVLQQFQRPSLEDLFIHIARGGEVRENPEKRA